MKFDNTINDVTLHIITLIRWREELYTGIQLSGRQYPDEKVASLWEVNEEINEARKCIKYLRSIQDEDNRTHKRL